MAKYFARPVRATGDLLLFCDGKQFGRFVNCEVCHIFSCDDQALEMSVMDVLEGGMTLHQQLKAIRDTHTRYVNGTLHLQEFDDYAAEGKMEMEAENAWLRHAERYDPEAQRDLELHDSLHPYGYGR
jgi:hypothetical protein